MGDPGKASQAQPRAGTLIGAGMRVTGRVVFTELLHVQGGVLGDVTSRDADGGTLVVDATGSVTGATAAARILVRGRLSGPLHAARMIELRTGGCLSGDVRYGRLVVQPGGILEGRLTPVAAAPEPAEPPRPTPPRAGAGRRAGLAVGVLLAAACGAVLLWLAEPAAPPAPAVTAGGQGESAEAPAAAVPSTPPAAAPAPREEAAAPLPPPAPVTLAPQEVVVEGVNPAKPPRAFLVVAREPVVLHRRKDGEEGEGRRLAVPRGRTVSVAIGRDELFRVAEGRNLDIFYQGRKVSPQLIERRAWLRFVPHGDTAEGQNKGGGTAP